MNRNMSDVDASADLSGEYFSGSSEAAMIECARTLGDLRRGLCRTPRPREPACDESAPLWDAIGLSDDTPIDVLRDRWTPLAACLLARADGTGPHVGAVTWVERGLDTAVLRGADLQGADLRCANLRNAVLRDADLRNADLRGADLRNADLRNADLRGAILSDADLSGAYRPEGGVPGWEPDSLGWLVLRRAEATMSDHARTLGDLRRGLCRTALPRDPACDESDVLWAAIGLPEGTPIGVLLERWTPIAACMLARADGAGPRVAAVEWVEHGLGTSVLRGADLRGADLSTAVLRGAVLSGADLRDAILGDAILGDADLRGAVLSGATLSGAVLSGAVLSDVILSDATLSGADLQYASLIGAVLSGADLRGANLRGADLSTANLRDADLRGADLRDAILDGAYRPEGGVPGWELDSRRLLRRAGG